MDSRVYFYDWSENEREEVELVLVQEKAGVESGDLVFFRELSMYVCTYIAIATCRPTGLPLRRKGLALPLGRMLSKEGR